MRKIEIREKIAPYSHVPGTSCLVPCSEWVLTAFPSRLLVAGLTDIPIGVTGPVIDFFVQMDLERDCVWVSGMAQEGPYRLQIEAKDSCLWLTVVRSPKDGIFVDGKLLQSKEKLLLAKGGKTQQRLVCERLSLGNWKAQNWDLVRLRNDPREIIPSLFLLGQKMPLNFSQSFAGILQSHLEENLHQTYLAIRSRLIYEEGTQVCVLPGIQEYPVGRSHLRASFGAVHLEWSQGMIRKMVINPSVNCERTFSFQKEVASFRVAGKRVTAGTPLFFVVGTQVLFDCFQK